MWWSSRKGGGRKVDEKLRRAYGIPSGTVQQPNSLRGAALIGGAMLAYRIRSEYPEIHITEFHPKALLQAFDPKTLKNCRKLVSAYWKPLVLVRRMFRGLHEGNVIRYRLRPADLAGVKRN